MVDDPEAIAAAYDGGTNFFFLSADLHWPRYAASRAGLAALLNRDESIRDSVVVAGVSYVAQPDFSRAPFEELIEAVPGLGRVDVLVIGGVYARDYEARRDVFLELRAEGFAGARALAATFHDRHCGLEAINAGDLDLAMFRFNPRHPAAATAVFPALSPTRHGLVYTFKSTTGYTSPGKLDSLGLDAGVHRPAITDYYRFALGHPAVDGLLVSPTIPAHVAELTAALQAGALEPDESEHLIALADFVGAASAETR